MDQALNELVRSVSLVDLSGLVTVLGLALYGLTGAADDDGFDGAGGDGE